MAHKPRPKKCKLQPSQSLPLIPVSSEGFYGFKGAFNGYSVVVDKHDDMKNLIKMGYFGKANLSRTYPQFNEHKPKILRNRVFQNRKKWSKTGAKAPEKVIVVPDSDSSNEDEYFTNLKPQYQLDCSAIKEVVHLGLEESFFLAAGLNCLQITHEGSVLDVEQAWRLFTQNDHHFITNYVVYYYYRSKNWIVKSGIKFGGDFLLYKQGPPFYHASYVVLIHVVDENFKRIDDFSRRSMKNIHLMGLNRLCETAGKELLICEIVWPNTVDHAHATVEDVPKFSIKENIMKRWLPSQEINSKT